jgi:1-acyl-sn-glycerol-3-phosphate acyltransferase
MNEIHNWRPSFLYRLLARLLDVLVHLVFDLHVTGSCHVPRRGPGLVAVKHVSHLDPCVIFVVVRRIGRTPRFLGVSSLFDVPIVRALLRLAGAIPVVRGAGAERMAADVIPALDAGELVVVYPEGTIPPSGEILAAKRGTALLSLTTAAPVVPVASWGLGLRRSGGSLRRRAVVAFGPPIDLSPWAGRRDRDAQAEVSVAIMDAIRGLLSEAERVAERRC